MKFDPRIRLGDLAVIGSLVLFIFICGEWKKGMEMGLAQATAQNVATTKEVKKLSYKLDDAIENIQDYQDQLNTRLARVEGGVGQVTKGLGLPPYGPNNPPPIIKYRHRQGEQQIE